MRLSAVLRAPRVEKRPKKVVKQTNQEASGKGVKVLANRLHRTSSIPDIEAPIRLLGYREGRE